MENFILLFLLGIGGFQGCSEGTSSVAFEVLIINCQMYFINLLIFNCVTLNIKLFIFKSSSCLTSNFCFPKIMSFKNRRERLVYGVMGARPQFRILNSPEKMKTVLQDINKFLRQRTLYKSILKCGFPTKGIELTRGVLFEILGVPQL